MVIFMHFLLGYFFSKPTTRPTIVISLMAQGIMKKKQFYLLDRFLRYFFGLDLKKGVFCEPFIVRNLVNSIRTVESADTLNEKLNRTF